MQLGAAIRTDIAINVELLSSQMLSPSNHIHNGITLSALYLCDDIHYHPPVMSLLYRQTTKILKKPVLLTKKLHKTKQ